MFQMIIDNFLRNYSIFPNLDSITYDLYETPEHDYDGACLRGGGRGQTIKTSKKYKQLRAEIKISKTQKWPSINNFIKLTRKDISASNSGILTSKSRFHVYKLFYLEEY